MKLLYNANHTDERVKLGPVLDALFRDGMTPHVIRDYNGDSTIIVDNDYVTKVRLLDGRTYFVSNPCNVYDINVDVIGINHNRVVLYADIYCGVGTL